MSNIHMDRQVHMNIKISMSTIVKVFGVINCMLCEQG